MEIFYSNRPDYYLENVNMPENTVFYVKKLISLFKKTKRFTIVIATFWVRSLSQENKKIYYCDCYIFGQVVEASN